MGYPVISVIIPIFNEEKYIDRCMESLKKQSYRNLQIILIDGGSTDGSPAICDEWAKRWNMGECMGIVEVIHTTNKGVSVSRNKGLAHATGEYVTFIDGDDWLEAVAIETMYKALVNNNAELSGCNFMSRKELPTDNNTEAIETSIKVLDSKEYISQRLLYGDVHCWGRLYRRDIIGSQKFREGMTIGEDMVFLTEYLMKCKKVVCVEATLYNYYLNPKGAMDRAFTISAMDQVYCWQEVGKLIEASEDDAVMIKSHVIISVLLTVGRLAKLPFKERKQYLNIKHSEHGDVLAKLKKELKNNFSLKAFMELNAGYKAKVVAFRLCPHIYMSLYHTHKS